MIQLIAEAASTSLPDPNGYAAIGWVVVIIGGIFVILNSGADFINRFKAKEPTPPLHEQFATKDELDEVKEEVRGLDRKIDDRFDQLRLERSKSVAELHKRIEAISAGLNDRVTELLGGFRELRGRVEQALKETKSPFGK